MHFELLNETHAPALLHFELHNQAFFERVIAPRASDFYSATGSLSHIQGLLNDETASAYVLMEGENIIARANLKHINPEHTAEIGYRVSEHSIGKGIASKCVDFLVQQSSAYNLQYLYAYVMDNNPASEKVLVNNEFQCILCLPDEFLHQGKALNGFKYQRKLL